jgi:hypothetical protein
LQLQIKQELYGGLAPLYPLPALCPGSAGDLVGPQTSCLTRKEILVMALEACVSNRYMYSLIVFYSFFILYLMCCFGNNPLYMDFTPIKIMFWSVLFCTLHLRIWYCRHTGRCSLHGIISNKVSLLFHLFPSFIVFVSVYIDTIFMVTTTCTCGSYTLDNKS